MPFSYAYPMKNNSKYYAGLNKQKNEKPRTIVGELNLNEKIIICIWA